MREVGAFEAGTHLSALLAAVEGGEEVLITRRGRPVARLVPPEAPVKDRRAALRTRLGAADLTPGEILSARHDGRPERQATSRTS